MTDKLVYSIDEASQKLGISRNLAYRLAREGKLVGVIHIGERRMVVAKSKVDALLGSNPQP
jgi:excisionase family DNA binding protein